MLSAPLPRRRRRAAGVTLVEAVMVVVGIGLVTAVTTPRFLADRSFLEQGYYEELTAAVGYAQRLAAAGGCSVQLQITSGGYAARRVADGGCALGEIDSVDEPLFSGESPAGVAVTPSATITFDAHGRANLRRDRVIRVGPFELTVPAGSARDPGY